LPKRIVYTRPDGGVSICAPSLTALRFMTGGGGRWDGYPRGFLDRQISKQAEECGERNAHRFVIAMQFGGCTDAVAYELMRDRFCAHQGTGIELWDVGDVPKDRWFRDAWVRSHNGGPIDISLSKARDIQFRKIKAAVAFENNHRMADLDLFDCPLTPDWSTIRDAIRRADDVAKLRRVWLRQQRSIGSTNFRLTLPADHVNARTQAP
jgi:hypothetical protein